MRGVLCSILLTFAVVAASAAKTSAASPTKSTAISAPVTFAMQAQTADKTLDINITQQGGGRRWYASPMWIAIGAIAVVVVLMLLVMAVRGGGGGTTVVKG